MSKLGSLFLILAVVVVSFGIVQAQSGDSCGLLVDSVLESAQAACGDLGNNEVCHASSPVQLTLPDEVVDVFESGDIVDFASVGRLSTKDETSNDLGIAIANAQMNLSEGAVQMVLFGDATLINLVEAMERVCDNQENRLVYELHEDKLVIFQCCYHYPKQSFENV